jgi:decaprenylphospho-beta-D-ribofuranose 2-oxidase
MTVIHGWGRYPKVEAEIFLPPDRVALTNYIQDSKCVLPRGFGRSYGDSANNSTVIQTHYLDNFLELDVQRGVLTCQAGVSIHEILEYVVPKGWFIPVTPGSSYVSIGGAIASDVHGKNHHISGTLSEHIIEISLILASGELVHLSREHLPELFYATCGGMGLTGIIFSAVIQLKPITSSYILQKTHRLDCLEDVCAKLDESLDTTYNVAWIDCLVKGRQLGRSLLMLGEHDQSRDLDSISRRQLNIPFEMPTFLLNTYSVKAFNFLYYHKSKWMKNNARLTYESYFYPLDSITNWNRLYGKKGFVQYQFVIPKQAGVSNLKKILEMIVEGGMGSFLAVLKIFGKANNNYLSFPIEGYTLALDFKLSDKAIDFLHRLDEIVVDMGGRVYLTKDALMSETSFKRSYPQWEKFQDVRDKYGAIGKFSSNQSRRLGLE